MSECPDCNGYGYTTEDCFVCSGTGACGFCDDALEIEVQCDMCNGTGEIDD